MTRERERERERERKKLSPSRVCSHSLRSFSFPFLRASSNSSTLAKIARKAGEAAGASSSFFVARARARFSFSSSSFSSSSSSLSLSPNCFKRSRSTRDSRDSLTDELGKFSFFFFFFGFPKQRAHTGEGGCPKTLFRKKKEKIQANFKKVRKPGKRRAFVRCPT